MSFGSRTDEIVIKKKRRRTAVDPCLGYYKQDDGASDSVLYQEEGTSKNQEVQQNVQQKGEAKKSVVSSDSAPAITSPVPDSEDAAVVTVDDFLRQQATAGPRCSRTTYSRKRHRAIQFSSDEEAESPAVDDNDRINVSCPIPLENTQRGRNATRNKPRMSNNAKRRSRSLAETTFSKRIQRAAILSFVEPDVDFLTLPAPTPLHLVPHDKLTPRTPTNDKRIKLINPRVPRRLDTSFANKENIVTPAKTKTCRPFLQWSCSVPKIAAALSPSPLSALAARRHSASASRSMITPLALVPYEEHDMVRSAKFDQKSCRREQHRMITSLVLRPTCHASSPPATDVNAIEDPFLSFPISAEPRVQVHHSPTQHDQDVTVEINPSNVSSDFPDPPDILVPDTSQSPSSALYNSPAGVNAKVNNKNNDLQNLQVTYAPGSLPASVPNPEGVSLSHDQSAPQPDRSQKPMHRIGTMLDGLRERARSFLLSQSQMQVQIPSDEAPEPSSHFGLRTKGTKRMSTRRLVFSSPARYSPSTSATKSLELPRPPSIRGANESATFSLRATRNNSRGREGLRVRKSISMPSVSGFLRVGRDARQRQTEEQPPNLRTGFASRSHRPSYRASSGVQIHPENLPNERYDISMDNDLASFNIDCDHDHGTASDFNVAPLPLPSLFEYHNGLAPPNLFDLLEDVEPRCSEQVILSPSV